MRDLPPDSRQHATVKNYECHALVNRCCRSSEEDEHASSLGGPSDARRGPDTQALELEHSKALNGWPYATASSQRHARAPNGGLNATASSQRCILWNRALVHAVGCTGEKQNEI
jgi:hypothetical protein